MQRGEITSKPRSDTLHAVGYACLLCVITFGFLYISHQYRSQAYQSKTQSDLSNRLSIYMHDIERYMGSRFAISQGVGWLVTHNPHIKEREFRRIADQITQTTEDIHSLILAKANHISHIYPPQDNESLLGINLSHDPIHATLIDRAVIDGATMQVGPYELTPGVPLLLIHTPVFVLREDKQRQFWGLSSVTILWDHFLEEVGLIDVASELQIAVRSMGENGETGATLYGDARIFDQAPSLMTITLPHTQWQIAGLPQGGWETTPPNSLYWDIGSLLVLVMLLTIGWITARYPLHLREAATKASRQLFRLQYSLAQQLEEGSVRERNLHGLLTSLPAPIIVTERATSKTLFANDLATQLFEEPIGSSGQIGMDYYVDPAMRQKFIDQLMDKGRVNSLEIEMKTRSGRHFWALFSAVLIEYEGKDAILLVLHDLTRRKEVEQALMQSEENLRRVYETVPTPMVITQRSDGLALRLNPAAIDLFGIHDVMDMPLKATDYYVHAEDRQRLFVELQKRGYVDDFELQMHNHAGDIFTLIMSATMLEYNGAPALLTSFTNITERKQMESDLHRAIEDAQQAVRVKDEFLATMSHEIRTPLNGALSMARLLSKTELTEEQREYVDAINFSGEALLTVISDVLDLSIIEAGKIRLEEADFELHPMVENIVRLLSSRAENSGNILSINIDSEILPFLVGDSTRLRQILFNLIGNAIKFTENGKITLSIYYTEKTERDNHRSIRFEVSDTGIGISQEIQERVFETFTQADSSINRRYGGSGLGLAICRRMVKLMGGEIGVVSREGAGSTFWFELPLNPGNPSSPPDRERQPEQCTDARGLEILLVEDDLINQRAETALLKQDGHQVTVADDGFAALAILERYQRKDSAPFDLILMDIRMPGIDGLETTRRIRNMAPPISTLPVIALTADVTQQNIEACRKAGIAQTLSKPIRPEELADALLRIDSL